MGCLSRSCRSACALFTLQACDARSAADVQPAWLYEISVTGSSKLQISLSNVHKLNVKQRLRKFSWLVQELLEAHEPRGALNRMTWARPLYCTGENAWDDR